MRVADQSSFKYLLDEQYNYPCHYTFKFLVGIDKREEILELLEGGVLIKERLSKHGNYVALTFSQEVHSSEDVIAVYKKVSKVKGVTSL